MQNCEKIELCVRYRGTIGGADLKDLKDISKKIRVLRDIDIHDLKDEIFEKKLFDFDIDPSLQELTFDGATLADDKTLQYYHIDNGKTIDLSIDKREIQIRILNTVTKTNREIYVPRDIFIAQLKKKIAGIFNIAASQQRLDFKGKTLSDDHRLAYYNVQDEDEIMLALARLRGG